MIVSETYERRAGKCRESRSHAYMFCVLLRRFSRKIYKKIYGIHFECVIVILFFRFYLLLLSILFYISRVKICWYVRVCGIWFDSVSIDHIPFTYTAAILNRLMVYFIMGCWGGQTNGSVSVLLYLISFYFDRLKYFCESKLLHR